MAISLREIRRRFTLLHRRELLRTGSAADGYVIAIGALRNLLERRHTGRVVLLVDGIDPGLHTIFHLSGKRADGVFEFAACAIQVFGNVERWMHFGDEPAGTGSRHRF